MSESSKAIFLSYAREDAGAARRIADALRSTGLEVWFDESELRGGDAWDAKIRRQIDECSLFVPIISQHTQERSKGYFRLEWKLAVDQTHLLAAGIPFVAPVVIDATKESEAVVPPEFMKVQWTRLSDGLPTSQFIEQTKRLLSGEQGASSREPGGQKTEGRGQRTEDGGRNSEGRAAPRKSWLVPTIVGVVVAVGLAVFMLRKPASTSAEAAVDKPLAATESKPAPAVNDKSIAVLPFENMSEDKDNNAFFADGVHEDILTNLAYIHDLRVVSRTSVAQYRETKKPISQIAQELKVTYVLEGSVRRAGSKIRVTGQLIRAATDEHVWAKAYDRDVTDVFSVQAELAQAIAAALQSVIAPEARALIDRRPTENPAAYDAFLKARQLLAQGGLLDEEIIIRHLQQAVRLDPNFAAAWAMLAGRNAFAYFNRDKSDERLAQAKTAIDTAVRLAPADPEVIEGLGDYYYYGFRDYARAMEQYRQLVQLRPNDPSVFASLAFISRRQGRFPDAVANMRRAAQLDPDDGGYAGELTATLKDCRKYDEAMAAGRQYLQRHPDHLFIAATVAEAEYAQSGKTDAIRAFARRTVATEERSRFLYLQLLNARMIGDWAEAIRLDREQSYFDGDTDVPRWMQEVLAAATLAEGGDLSAARARAAETMPVMNAELARQPLSPHLWASLSLGHALLGEKTEAVRCGDKAREALPESRDALMGPIISAMRASALAWAGEKDQAVAEFERLLHVVYGVNPVFERGMYLASWKPLRGDPRFEALLADPKNNTPFF